MLATGGLKPFQNGGVDHGHLRSGPRVGPHQPLKAISTSVSDRCLGCLHDCLNGSGSPKLGSSLAGSERHADSVGLIFMPRPVRADDLRGFALDHSPPGQLGAHTIHLPGDGAVAAEADLVVNALLEDVTT